MENLPIVLEDKCKEQIQKITGDDKYVIFKDCKNLVKIDKNNFENISNNIVGKKCAEYIKKQLIEKKDITRKDLIENCENFKKVAEDKKKKGGRRGGGRGGGGMKALPLPKPDEKKDEDKETKIDDYLGRMTDVITAIGKAATSNDPKEVIKAVGTLVKTVCMPEWKSISPEQGLAFIQDSLEGIFHGKMGIGWAGDGKYILDEKLYGELNEKFWNCVGKLTGVLFSAWAIWKIWRWWSPAKDGTRPSGDDGDDGGGGGGGGQPPRDGPRPALPDITQPPSGQPPSGQQPPSTTQSGTGTTAPPGLVGASASTSQPADVLKAWMTQQKQTQAKKDATSTFNQLAREVLGSHIHDETTLTNMGLVQTPYGLMKKDAWEKRQKQEESAKKKAEEDALKRKQAEFKAYDDKVKEADQEWADAVDKEKNRLNLRQGSPIPNFPVREEFVNESRLGKAPEGYKKNWRTIRDDKAELQRELREREKSVERGGISGWKLNDPTQWNIPPKWLQINPKTGLRMTQAEGWKYREDAVLKEPEIQKQFGLKDKPKPYMPRYTREEWKAIYNASDTLQQGGSLDDTLSQYNFKSNKQKEYNDKYLRIMGEQGVPVPKPRTLGPEKTSVIAPTLTQFARVVDDPTTKTTGTYQTIPTAEEQKKKLDSLIETKGTYEPPNLLDTTAPPISLDRIWQMFGAGTYQPPKMTEEQKEKYQEEKSNREKRTSTEQLKDQIIGAVPTASLLATAGATLYGGYRYLQQPAQQPNPLAPQQAPQPDTEGLLEKLQGDVKENLTPDRIQQAEDNLRARSALTAVSSGARAGLFASALMGGRDDKIAQAGLLAGVLATRPDLSTSSVSLVNQQDQETKEREEMENALALEQSLYDEDANKKPAPTTEMGEANSLQNTTPQQVNQAERDLAKTQADQLKTLEEELQGYMKKYVEVEQLEEELEEEVDAELPTPPVGGEESPPAGADEGMPLFMGDDSLSRDRWREYFLGYKGMAEDLPPTGKSRTAIYLSDIQENAEQFGIDEETMERLIREIRREYDLGGRIVKIQKAEIGKALRNKIDGYKASMGLGEKGGELGGGGKLKEVLERQRMGREL